MNQRVESVSLRAYLVGLRFLSWWRRAMMSETDEFRLSLLIWINSYTVLFGGLRPTVGDIAKGIGRQELPDGTLREGRSRNTIQHHVNVLVGQRLLDMDGSTVWLTEKGRQVAALESFASR